jgi:hypothetical protein
MSRALDLMLSANIGGEALLDAAIASHQPGSIDKRREEVNHPRLGFFADLSD